jgi:hypothetical protein
MVAITEERSQQKVNAKVDTKLNTQELAIAPLRTRNYPLLSIDYR